MTIIGTDDYRARVKVTAQVRRSGGWWAVEVPEVPGVFTQARRLEDVPVTAADAVAAMLGDVEVEDVAVNVELRP